MKRKIGIITLCSNDNFGNKLQNYALKKYLEKHNLSVNTIWIDHPSKMKLPKKIVRILINKLKSKKKRKYIEKTKKFKKFSKKYLNNDYRIRISDNLSKIDNDYDFFVVGSDQVWNYKYINDYDFYFMKKIKKEKCFSYAASFGVYDIPKEYVHSYESGLRHLNFISVREERGKELVKSIADRDDVQVLVDPTMLLTKEEWENTIENIKMKNLGKYILLYFLGNIGKERYQEIEKQAKKYNCKIINIMDTKSKYYASDPFEFIYLIKNAFLICTDSFHASVFSILFNKAFIIYDRVYNGKNMNSRIDTLLGNLKIQNRRYNEKYITEDNLKPDYKEAYEILEVERKKSYIYLKNALKDKKSKNDRK